VIDVFTMRSATLPQGTRVFGFRGMEGLSCLCVFEIHVTLDADASCDFDLPGRVPADRAEKLLADVLGAPLLVQEHPAERDPRIGGVMKEEWDVERGAAHAHKLFYDEPFPADYARHRALMDELVQHGARQLLSQKRDP
jgi:hypothetical protein